MKPDFTKQITWGNIKRKDITWDNGQCSYVWRLFDLPVYMLIEDKDSELIIPVCYLPKEWGIDKLYISTKEFLWLHILSLQK